ncbi:hypothetical protein F2Q70_00034013 [Brassica cretica]|uniref:Uncharacterized protein n=1 Tax=Brassica cretica TaxID=69181 RepID=A0A8S9JRL5_BRACR|nr:hypothetical protein F2Q70_00034013 [Brassica cretica]KAF3531025.1 hypothetical protein DY000_02036672 [Brassica cretica]
MIECQLNYRVVRLQRIIEHQLFSDDGQDVEGLPTEGVEITCFHLDGSHYMVYTPSDPLLFVAAKASL